MSSSSALNALVDADTKRGDADDADDEDGLARGAILDGFNQVGVWCFDVKTTKEAFFLGITNTL
jgi:hypothetical protein